MKMLALIGDVFRQSRSSAMFWVLIILSALTAACVACVGFDGDQIVFLGARLMHVPADQQASAIKTLLVSLDSSLLGTVGMILMVIATGNFWPGFLTRGWVLLTLGKPVCRPTIFVGRVLGAVLFVAFQATVFALLTLAAAGLRTGHWIVGHLAVVPITVGIFLVVYSVSCLVGILSRSTVFAILAAIGFWFLCSIATQMDYVFNRAQVGVHMTAGSADEATLDVETGDVPERSVFGRIVHVAYLVLPKTGELDGLMHRAIYEGPPTGPAGSIERIDRQHRKASKPDYAQSLWTSGLAVLVLFAAGLWRFRRTDY